MNKVVVITGGSAGIGAALAKQVHAAGGRPVLVARRADALAEVAKQCGGASTIVADVTKRADVERALKEALAAAGHVDVWVNNAGRGITRLPSQLTDADLDEMMQVNVKSALYGMQTVLPYFQQRGEGQVINVSSMLGRMPFALPRAAYSASKHFLNALTASFRQEVQASHPKVHVSLFSPGAVTTDFGLNALHGGADSRTLPNAQSAEEVAAGLVQLINEPKADQYSREGMRQTVVDYFAKL